MHSRERLADDFRALGVEPGDTIMLHASVRSVGAVAGGPDQIHLALKDALTETGTLMMLAGCPQHFDEVGRGNLTAEEEAEVLDKLPPFDHLTARADRSNGILVEFFRTSPGSRVNNHVVRFVTWGKDADFLLSEQPWDFAFGSGSALEKLAVRNGKILMLGSDHDTVTFLHYAEHILDIPHKRIARYKVPVQEGGRRVWKEMLEVDSNTGAHANWPDRFFARIVDSYLATQENWGGWVGNAKSYLFHARGLLEFALSIMRETAGAKREG